MRWPAEPSYIDPVDGTTRTRVFFAWFPEEVCGEIFWLQFVTVREVFQVARCYGDYHGWIPVKVLS